MALTNAGRNFVAEAVMNDDTPTFFDNTHAYIGVGDSTTAFAATQTDLQAATNKYRKGMDTGYPQRVDNTLTFSATFLGTDANYDWNEWAVFNASTDGVMLNRLVEDNGTKVSGQTWVMEVDITFNIGS